MNDPGPRLLMVEDDAPLREVLTWGLGDLGYRVVAVGTCREARERIAQGGIDLALLDCQLPDGSGFDLADALRERWPRVPVVLTSGLRPAPGSMDGLPFAPKPASAAALHALFLTLLGPVSPRSPCGPA